MQLDTERRGERASEADHIFIFLAAFPPPNDELERFEALLDSIGGEPVNLSREDDAREERSKTYQF